MVIGILNNLILKGVTYTELNDSKSNLKGNMKLDLQDIETSAFHNGLSYLMDNENITSYNNLYDKYYANVTKSQVHDIIRKYLIKENMSVCLLGEHVPSLEKVKDECEKLCTK